MKIKYIHAHFLVPVGDYSNERVGFTAELEENETIQDVVSELRSQAIEVIGNKAKDLYNEKWKVERELNETKRRLREAREQWNQTAEFLRAQGIRPDASPMPRFSGLLLGKVEEEQVIEAEEVDPHDIPFND